MFDAAHALAYSAVLAWVMVMAAAGLGGQLWTPGGLKYSLGNRGEAREKSDLAGRADRAAKNMLENLVLFASLVAAAHFAGSHNKLVVIGANVFFWARVAYWPVYLAGIPVVRTLIWSVGVAGMGMIAVSV